MAYDTTEAVAKFLSGFQMKITNRERDTVAPDYYVKYSLTLSKGGKDFSTTFVSDPRASGEPTVTQVFSALVDDALTLRRLPAWKGTSPLSVDPEAGRRLSMISGTVSLRVATTFPWRATTAHPAGTRSRRMHLQGMRPEGVTRTSGRTRSEKNRKTGCRIPYGSGISTNAKKNGRCE